MGFIGRPNINYDAFKLQLEPSTGQTIVDTLRNILTQKAATDAQLRQNSTPTAQAVAAGLVPEATGGNAVTLPNGQKIVIGQQTPAKETFGPRIQNNIIDQLGKKKAEEAAMEKAVTLQNHKAKDEIDKTHTLVNQDMLDNYPAIKKMGYQVGHYIPNTILGAQGKPPPAGSANVLTEDESKALNAAAKQHPDRFPPDLMKGRGSIQKFIAQQVMQNPEYDPSELNINYGQKRSSGTSKGKIQGGQGQSIGAAAGSMDDMMTLAEPLIAKVGPSKFKVLNGALQAGLNEVNDPDLHQVYTYLTSAAGFYASLQKNGGVPDEGERAAAMKVISSKLNSGGFAAVKEALHKEAVSRVKRITGQGFDEPSPVGTEYDTSVSYNSPDEVKAGYKAGKLTKDQAKKMLEGLGFNGK